ncbi:hypothetical protein SASPL_150778 [Salvia splendens]|uniref:Mitochondrial glycoprotein n=1 Tax=Salvia splendens TaxID=180675 RepID=A0A8X8W6L4_SALSN|nr:uncharacterized protein At2g39795, mitochondrial-like [Salvia splendens]XP_042034716.1 uncharacterized protein At2g39795, mitochondrial-like [Salvia splendens]KAG6389310.1 hypothetical protein SASPL_150778 [Salvia splendens]
MGGNGALMRSLLNSFSPSIIRHRSLIRQFSYSDAIQSQSQSSSSPSPSSPFESRLRTILRNEIQYQYDYAPPHQPVTEFERFSVEDQPGQQWITLRAKSAEDENIKIEATMFDGSILEPKSDDEDTEEVVRLHISMLVDIWKGKETDSMEFVCSAWPYSLEIQKVYMFKQDNSPAQPYMGPDMKNLSNKLRTGFYEFLNYRGINSDLSRFLHQYMMNKDRIELLHWLGKVQSYIEK